MKLILLSVVTALLALGIGAAPSYAKPTGVKVHPSARCPVFWSAMTRAVPQDSAPYKEFIARKEAWLAHATEAIGETEANRILNADGPFYGSKVREMARDANALQTFAADYTECETVPANGAKTARNDGPLTSAKTFPTVTAKDKEGGEHAFRCAGMAQMNEDIENFIAIKLYGKKLDYLPIIKHFRPDLSDIDIKEGVTSAQIEYAKLLKRDRSLRQSHTMAGKEWDIAKSEVMILARKCAQMANVMSDIIQK